MFEVSIRLVFFLLLMRSLLPLAQVLLAPNFSAMVSRSVYEDPAYPSCRFVDITQCTGKMHVF